MRSTLHRVRFTATEYTRMAPQPSARGTQPTWGLNRPLTAAQRGPHRLARWSRSRRSAVGREAADVVSNADNPRSADPLRRKGLTQAERTGAILPGGTTRPGSPVAQRAGPPGLLV
jgi:hypothetical protein